MKDIFYSFILLDQVLFIYQYRMIVYGGLYANERYAL